MENEKKKNNKQLFAITLVAMLAVLIIIGGTYAWLRVGTSATKTNVIKAGALDLRIDETPTDGAEVRLEKAIPQSYRQGISNKPYKFTLINNSTIATDYTITLEDFYEGADASLTNDDKIADNLIRYILVKNDEEMVASNSKLLSTGRTITSGTIRGRTGGNPVTIPFTLYIWIDSKAGDIATEAELMSKVFNSRLGITAEQRQGVSIANLQRDVWVNNHNELCMKTVLGDECMSPYDDYYTTKGFLSDIFGESACTEVEMGSAANLMWICNGADAKEYKSCYIQSYSSGEKSLYCTDPVHTYKGMTGSKTCSATNRGNKAFSPGYGHNYSCYFITQNPDTGSSVRYYFDDPDSDDYYES